MTDVTVPPNAPPPVAKEAAEYQRLMKEAGSAYRRCSDLRIQMERAEQQDRQALADSLRSQKPDPGSVNVKRVSAELEEAKRRLDGLYQALDDAFEDLETLVLEHREEWLERALADVDKARLHYRERVEEMIEARHHLDETRTAIEWLERFPRKPAFIPRKFNFAGDAWVATERALRADAADPAPELFGDEAKIEGER